MKNLIPIICMLLTFTVCYKVIPAVIRIAHLKNLVDEPNHRTSHKRAVPTLGGVGIYLSFSIIALLFAPYYYMPEFNYLLLGMMVLFFLGIKDDIVVLSARKKLIGQIGVALLITILGDLRITTLQGILNIYDLPYIVSVVLSAFIYIALINAINLIDGIDGLASGVGMLCLSFLGVNFYLLGHYGWSMLCFAMVGSLLAFFLYNVYGKTNKIFMGDTGSLVLGLFLTASTIKFIELNNAMVNPFTISFAPAVAIAMLVLPIFDTIRVFSIRIANGKSPFTPDKNHIHHLLLKLGFKHKQTTLLLVSINSFFILTAYAFGSVNINVLLLLISTLALSLIGVLVAQRNKSERRRIRAHKQLLNPSDPIVSEKIKLESGKIMEHIN